MIKVKVWIYLKKLIQLKVITLYANNENLILTNIVNEIFYLWSIEVRMMRTLYDQIIKLYVWDYEVNGAKSQTIYFVLESKNFDVL